MGRLVRFLITHGIALALGFALGIYLLPILIAPEGPSDAEVAANVRQAMFETEFSRELAGSDFLHWGEGQVSISARRVSFSGALAPGPDYRLYLTPEFVVDEAGFNAIKSQSAEIGPIKSFDRFILELPPGVDPGSYRAVVVWCETFGEFITAAEYR